MLFRFASYCRNQQFMRQIIRKPFTPFCLSNQNIEQHINTLMELRQKYQSNFSQSQSGQLLEEICKYENDLDSYLTKFMVHQTTILLVSKTFNLTSIQNILLNQNQSIKYIESAMCGDYENHYKEEWIQQVFLAELYGIKFRINYHKKEVEFALKSLTHWANILNHYSFNYCQGNKPIDVNAFTFNSEFIYYEQYLECQVALQKLYQVYGDFESSKISYDRAFTDLLESSDILYYFEEQLKQMKDQQKENFKQFIEHYKIQFFKFSTNSFISSIKISIWERNFKQALNLIQSINQSLKYVDELQQIHLLTLEYDLVLLSGGNYQKLEQIKQLIKSNFQKAEPQCNSEYLLCSLEHDIFQYKYVVEPKYKLVLLYKIMQYDQFRQVQIEFNCFRIEKLILNKNFSEVLELCLQSIHFLKSNQQFKHYFWDSLIFSTLLAAYRENDIGELEIQLQYIKKKVLSIIDRPLSTIIQFFELILELERNQKNNNKIDLDLLLNIKLLEFEQFFIKYQKQLVLEKIYKKYNLKKELDECYENKINILSENKDLYWQNLEEIYIKQKDNKV